MMLNNMECSRFFLSGYRFGLFLLPIYLKLIPPIKVVFEFFAGVKSAIALRHALRGLDNNKQKM